MARRGIARAGEPRGPRHLVDPIAVYARTRSGTDARPSRRGRAGGRAGAPLHWIRAAARNRAYAPDVGIGAIIGGLVAATVVGGLVYAFIAGGRLLKQREANLRAFAASRGLTFEPGAGPLTFVANGELEGADVVVRFETQLRPPGGQHLIASFSATVTQAWPVMIAVRATSHEAREARPGLVRFDTGDAAFDGKFVTFAENGNSTVAIAPALRRMLGELSTNLRGYVALETGPRVEVRYRVGTTDEEFDPVRLAQILDTVVEASRRDGKLT